MDDQPFFAHESRVGPFPPETVTVHTAVAMRVQAARAIAEDGHAHPLVLLRVPGLPVVIGMNPAQARQVAASMQQAAGVCETHAAADEVLDGLLEDL